MTSSQPERSFGFLLADVARLMTRNFDRRAQKVGLSRAQPKQSRPFGLPSLARTDLRICAGELRFLFRELKTLSPGVKLHQNISSFYFLVDGQMGCHDAAADSGFDCVRRSVYFQLGFIRDRID